MKICWDNLEKLRWSKKTGKWYKGNTTYEYCERCGVCGESYLKRKRELVCSYGCSSIGRVLSVETKKKIGDKAKIRFSNPKNNPMYGKKHTEKTKEKIRQFNLGRKHTEESRKKMSDMRSGEKHHMYGKSHSEETKKKMVDAAKLRSHENHPWLGRKHSEQSREKMSVAASKRIGERNPAWRGGISRGPYCSGWEVLAREYKSYDDGCMYHMCEKRSENLVSHHIDYDKQNCHPSNIITLCRVCHGYTTGNREWWTSYFKALKWRRNGNI